MNHWKQCVINLNWFTIYKIVFSPQLKRHCPNGMTFLKYQSQSNHFSLSLNVNRGYEQQEVTCNPNLRDAAAVWNVEDNRFPRCMSI